MSPKSAKSFAPGLCCVVGIFGLSLTLASAVRAAKVAKIPVPDVKVEGCVDDADLLIVGFGGTYGHLYSAMEEMNAAGRKVALAHFVNLNPLPANTAEVLSRYNVKE